MSSSTTAEVEVEGSVVKLVLKMKMKLKMKDDTAVQISLRSRCSALLLELVGDCGQEHFVFYDLSLSLSPENIFQFSLLDLV